ncbi:MAG: tetratricopeptide repeat protein [Pirellulales bacterium]
MKKPNKGIGTTRPKRLVVLFSLLVALLFWFLFLGGARNLALQRAQTNIYDWSVESAEWWLRVAEFFGKNGETVFLRARISRLNGDIDEFKSQLKEAHQLGIDPARLEREQEIHLLNIGEISPELEAKTEKWINESPPDVPLIVDAFVNGLASQSKFQAALRLLEAYEVVFPNDPMVNYRLGLIHEHSRNKAEAERQYNLAHSKNSRYFKAVWCLARIRSSSNSPQEAINLLKLHPPSAALAAKTLMAHCHEQLGDTETARTILTEVVNAGFEATQKSHRVIDETAERFLAAAELGVIETKLGNWENARKYLELALKANDRDFIARNSYSQVLRRLGLKDQADKELARIIEERAEYDKIAVLQDRIMKESGVEARVELGKILFKYESEKSGLFWIRSAISLDPNCLEAHQFLVDYFDKESQRPNSSEDLKKSSERRAKYHRGEVERINALSKAP